MKRHIEANLLNDPIRAAVFKTASAYKIKHNSKDFYVILAFMALMTDEFLERDIQAYRTSHPNPVFYSKLKKLQLSNPIQIII